MCDAVLRFHMPSSDTNAGFADNVAILIIEKYPVDVAAHKAVHTIR